MRQIISLCLYMLVFCFTSQCLLAQQGSDYKFLEVNEQITKPWHRHYLPTAKTADLNTNAGAKYLNKFLNEAFKDKLQKTAAKTPWQTYNKFLNWAVWGYLAEDSQFKSDPRLIDMMQVWLDTFFQRIATKPQNEKKAKSWIANRITDTWSFHDYTLPLLAIESDNQLQQQIGKDRIKRYQQIVIDSIADLTDAKTFNNLVERAENYINMATHPMAVYIHGWLLTGESKYLKMAQSIVTILHRDQMPNGMFPYRLKLHGPKHLEYETMYYRAIEMRALFVYWWATNSKMALECMQRSVPWYPLNLEPPYHFNDGADIWWKDQWRTFWPMHIAMVAAVTQDAENATIALNMARDNKSFDRFDLVLGDLAYQQMSNVKPIAVRDQYIIADPDIRGLRLRQSPWSCTFTTGSFTYTRASAMLVSNDGKNYDALHMARPCVRVTPLTKRSRIDPDYTMLGPEGTDASWIIQDQFAVVGTTYRPARTLRTWRPTIPTAPWRMSEIWLMTKQGMVGLIDSVATKSQDIYELNHQFRFITHNKQCQADPQQADTWIAGDLKLKICETNFNHRVLERARRYALNPKDRSDFQLSLTNQIRLPEQVAQDEKLSEQQKSQLPAKHTIQTGYHRYSLIQITSSNHEENLAVKRLAHKKLLGFAFKNQGKRYAVWFNPTLKVHAIESRQPTKIERIAPGKIKLITLN